MAVQSVLDGLAIPYHSIEIGRADLVGKLTPEQYAAVNTALRRYELEILTTRKDILVEKSRT